MCGGMFLFGVSPRLSVTHVLALLTQLPTEYRDTKTLFRVRAHTHVTRSLISSREIQ